jgi:hypothetical protein
MLMAAGNPANRSSPQPQDTGWVIAGAGADEGGGISWSNPGNITSDDGAYAECTGAGPSSFTAVLKASNFGLNVPSNATIDGIEVRFNGVSSSGPAELIYINIGKDDANIGTSKNPGTSVGNSEANYDYGGTADLWGLSLDYTDVNTSSFQARFEFDITVLVTIEIDAVWVKVHYTL